MTDIILPSRIQVKHIDDTLNGSEPTFSLRGVVTGVYASRGFVEVDIDQGRKPGQRDYSTITIGSIQAEVPYDMAWASDICCVGRGAQIDLVEPNRIMSVTRYQRPRDDQKWKEEILRGIDQSVPDDE